MEKINVAELLKDCPKGMELDCTMYDDVYFDYVDELNIIHCYIQHETHRTSITLNQHGTPNSDIKSKCVIFPKGKTTWEGFVPPCQFKDGDIIFTHANCLKVGLGNTWISIFQEKRNGGVATYVDYAEDGSDFYAYEDKGLLCMNEDIMRQRLATEEEKEKLFKAIKDKGYRWNPETKTLEKLIEPNFKVGDKVRHKSYIRRGYTVTEIKDTHYILDDELALPFTFQDEYEVVPNKFNINTLVPFESKVLVRNDEHQYWIPAFWGCKRADGYTTTFGWCKYCIPFEGNEHLLETNNDCNEFYKTWK